MKRAVVTGSAGFLGRHFTRALAEQDWYVREVDIADGEDALRCFRDPTWTDVAVDLLVHCAAIVGGRQVIEHDPMAQVVDFELDAAAFRWAVRTGTPMVYVSSSAIYPVDYQTGSDTRPLDEAQVNWQDGPSFGLPDALYGWTKLTGERIAAEVRRHVPVYIVRPFSGYGGDQSLDYPFPSFIDRARREARPFDVWGSGEQVRDWIHVSDIIAATLAMVEQGIMGPVNLCTGIGTSMDELARLCMQAQGYTASIRHHSDAPAGVAYRVGDPTRLNEFYTPQVTIEEGVRMALAGHG